MLQALRHCWPRPIPLCVGVICSIWWFGRLAACPSHRATLAQVSYRHHESGLRVLAYAGQHMLHAQSQLEPVMSRVEVIVEVDAKSPEEFHALASAAESVGLQIHPMGRIVGSGVLAGTIDRGALDTLKKMRGVVAVEESRKIKPLRDQ